MHVWRRVPLLKIVSLDTMLPELRVAKLKLIFALSYILSIVCSRGVFSEAWEVFLTLNSLRFTTQEPRLALRRLFANSL